MKNKTITLFIFFLSLNVIAQDIQFSDTIYTVTNKLIKTPAEKNITAYSTRAFSISAKLFDINKKFIRDIDHIWRSPNKAAYNAKLREFRNSGNRRGIPVQSASFVSIEEPGSYIVDNYIEMKNENGRILSKHKHYLLIVDYPHMASEIKLREEDPYYFSEKVTFSFATLEFDNPSAYSYQIVDETSGEIFQQSKGSTIVLDSLFANKSLINSTMLIKGYYDEKPFKYLYNGDKEPKLSEWKIFLALPDGFWFGTWIENIPQGTTRVISVENEPDKIIYYSMSAETPSGSYVFVKPDIRNVKISSDPDGIFEPNPVIESRGAFSTIKLNYTKEVLENMDVGDWHVIKKLLVEFKTKFNNDPVKTETSGVIIK